MADDSEPLPDLDALASFLEVGGPSSSELTIEAVVTLAEHRDRRVIAPLIDLLASGRADEMVVRAAGWFADPGLHPALVQLRDQQAISGGDTDGDEQADGDDLTGRPGPEFWNQVDRAIGRCRPAAAPEAEEIEVALLAATQASVLEVTEVDLDVSLVGAYPGTEIVIRAGDLERRHPIWDFDILNPDDPTTLDRPFTLYRIGTLSGLG